MKDVMVKVLQAGAGDGEGARLPAKLGLGLIHRDLVPCLAQTIGGHQPGHAPTNDTNAHAASSMLGVRPANHVCEKVSLTSLTSEG